MLKTNISRKRYLANNAIPTCNIDFNDSSIILSILEDTVHSSTGNNIALGLSYSSAYRLQLLI